MMYIRSKKNKSGSLSIQIIEKFRGTYKVIETVGVAHTETEEAELRRDAERRIRAQDPQLILFSKHKDDDVIEGFLNGNQGPVVSNIGPELVLGKIFNSVGLSQIPESLF